MHLHHNHMRMDCGASKCSATEPVESQMEPLEVDILDDNRARAGAGVGG